MDLKTRILPPNPSSLLESMRAIGYTFSSAICDIIDNSITAGASTIQILYDKASSKHYLEILDDGFGMSEDILLNAMRLGSTNPNDKRDENDLGRYGLGLKTASFSQCKTLTVITKHNGCYHGARWSLDTIASTNEWTLILLNQDVIDDIPNINLLKEQVSGTLVLWTDLDKVEEKYSNLENAFRNIYLELYEDIAITYHRFLEGKVKDQNKLNILINDKPVSPINPIHKCKLYQDITPIRVLGSSIPVGCYLVPHLSKLSDEDKEILKGSEGLRQRQGFYIYRNNRLLVKGDWCGISVFKREKNKFLRIVIDLPNTLDSLWELDVKKSKAKPPAIVVEALKACVQNGLEKSQAMISYRGSRDISDKDEQNIKIWHKHISRNNEPYYQINRENPIVSQLLSENDHLKDQINSLIELIELSLPVNSIYMDMTENNITNCYEDIQKARKAFMVYVSKYRVNLISKSQIEYLLDNDFEEFKDEFIKLISED